MGGFRWNFFSLTDRGGRNWTNGDDTTREISPRQCEMNCAFSARYGACGVTAGRVFYISDGMCSLGGCVCLECPLLDGWGFTYSVFKLSCWTDVRSMRAARRHVEPSWLASAYMYRDRCWEILARYYLICVMREERWGLLTCTFFEFVYVYSYYYSNQRLRSCCYDVRRPSALFCLAVL